MMRADIDIARPVDPEPSKQVDDNEILAALCVSQVAKHLVRVAAVRGMRRVGLFRERDQVVDLLLDMHKAGDRLWIRLKSRLLIESGSSIGAPQPFQHGLGCPILLPGIGVAAPKG